MGCSAGCPLDRKVACGCVWDLPHMAPAERPDTARTPASRFLSVPDWAKQLIETRDERAFFVALGLPCRAPAHRSDFPLEPRWHTLDWRCLLPYTPCHPLTGARARYRGSRCCSRHTAGLNGNRCSVAHASQAVGRRVSRSREAKLISKPAAGWRSLRSLMPWRLGSWRASTSHE